MDIILYVYMYIEQALAVDVMPRENELIKNYPKNSASTKATQNDISLFAGHCFSDTVRFCYHISKCPTLNRRTMKRKKRGWNTRAKILYIYGHLPEAMREASPKTTSAYQRCPMYVHIYIYHSRTPEII